MELQKINFHFHVLMHLKNKYFDKCLSGPTLYPLTPRPLFVHLCADGRRETLFDLWLAGFKLKLARVKHIFLPRFVSFE